MPHFTRRKSPPKVPGVRYERFREHVRQDFRMTCAYCLIEERWAGGKENFELDHFRPQSRFPQLLANYYNLYWSCHVCNHLKRDLWPSQELVRLGISFVDLCESSFDDHFAEEPSGRWSAKTLAGSYTIDALRLNRPHLVELRLFLRG